MTAPRMIPISLLALMIVATPATAAPSSTAIVSHIPRTKVNSSGIASIGYSKRRHILEIEFTSGDIYRYLQVSPAVYRDLIAADSKTRYYVSYIKRNYPSLRVRPRVSDEPTS